MSIQDDGAPTPLGPSLTSDPERSWSPKPQPPPETEAVFVPGEVKGAAQVRRAAQATAAVGGLVVAAVALYGAKTLRGILRR